MNNILRISINIGCALLIIFLATMPVMPVSAADNTGIGDVTSPGILPDSGFYFIKSWGRNFQLIFAGSDIEKARLMLKYSNEDALALQEMYELGKYDTGTKFAEQYALQLQNTTQVMEQVRTTQGQNTSEDLVNDLEENYLKQQEVLLSVLEKAPEAAQDGLLNALENSNKHIAAMVMAQNGEQALLQYEEQVNQQTNNMGEATKIKVQQKLKTTHGQASQSSNGGSSGQEVMTLTQTQIQSQSQTQSTTQNAQQTEHQNEQQNMQNQGAGQSNAGSGSDNQGSGNKNQSK